MTERGLVAARVNLQYMYMQFSEYIGPGKSIFLQYLRKSNGYTEMIRPLWRATQKATSLLEYIPDTYQTQTHRIELPLSPFPLSPFSLFPIPYYPSQPP